jgi:threonyl-tRNA synthetase
MIDLKFPDGSSRSFEDGVSGRAVAASISPSLEKKALLAKLDGQLLDLDRPLPHGGAIQIVTRDSPDALDTIRHDTAHVLAEAVQELFPGTQVTIGPNVEDGFYYDFARNEPFSLDDLPVIEKRMREIVQRDEKISREVWDRQEAIKHFRDIGEAYKAEIIESIPGEEPITVYRQGDWKDLCRGPHLPSTRHIGQGFKLTKLAGAYWRGDQRNAQLQRIYGTASRRPRSATTASWARPWTSSTSRKRPRAWCSGTPRAGPSIAPCRAMCSGASRRRATRR